MYDLIIIGAGPAGLAASIYASRYKLNHLVIGAEVGGTISWAHQVDNYPGLPGLTGRELAQKLISHAEKLGAEIKGEAVVDLVPKEDHFLIKTATDNSYETKTLILATGTRRKTLGVPGEKEMVGKGVSYCPTCDAPFYKGKTVIVVGGADAACSGAIHLAKFAQKVYLIYRRNQLRADPSWLKEIKEDKKIEVIYESNIVRILSTSEAGEIDELKSQKSKLKNAGQNSKTAEIREMVGAVELDKAYRGSKYVMIDGVFIEIGGTPVVELAKKLGIKIDDEGYIPTNEAMCSSVPGVYCVGDVGTHWRECQQVVTAVAEGAVATCSIYQYLHRN
jgi:thioredoxin reductase (NADPH)